ncbi:MAG: hypothetical protein F4X34_05710 [Chloroflexi bacterium]|nr:hypothetical protein [Chloroflexota bacterium]
MWKQLEGKVRFNLILGTSYILGALTLLIVMLTVDLAPEVIYGLLMLCVSLGLWGLFLLCVVGKEAFMKIGVVERILERRRIAAAADLAERYRGIDLMSSPEAAALPVPLYRCSGCERYWNNTADRMYWASSPCCRGDGTVRCASTGWMTSRAMIV